MAKLILSLDGQVIQEHDVNKERVTIGRKPHNDIQIDNLAVSGEHAMIMTILNDSFLEDLGSTNGTMVNGQPVKKHFLQNEDVVEIGKYKIKYVNDQTENTVQQEFEQTMVLRAPAESSTPAKPSSGNDILDHPKTIDTPTNAPTLSVPEATPAPTVPVPEATPAPTVPVPEATPAPTVPVPEATPVPTVPVPEAAPPEPTVAVPEAPPAPTVAVPGDPQAPTEAAVVPGAPPEPTVAVPGAPPAPATPEQQPVAGATAQAEADGAIQILSGPNAGRELPLGKPLTTVGKPGVQVAVIAKRPQGYFITHVEGANFPVVNGKPLHAQAHQLHDHDVIELAGVKMEFYLKS